MRFALLALVLGLIANTEFQAVTQQNTLMFIGTPKGDRQMGLVWEGTPVTIRAVKNGWGLIEHSNTQAWIPLSSLRRPKPRRPMPQRKQVLFPDDIHPVTVHRARVYDPDAGVMIDDYESNLVQGGSD